MEETCIIVHVTHAKSMKEKVFVKAGYGLTIF